MLFVTVDIWHIAIRIICNGRSRVRNGTVNMQVFFSVWKFLCAIYTFSFIQVLKTISPLFIESIALKPWTPVYNVNWHNKFKEQLAITTHTKRKRAAQLRFQY